MARSLRVAQGELLHFFRRYFFGCKRLAFRLDFEATKLDYSKIITYTCGYANKINGSAGVPAGQVSQPKAPYPPLARSRVASCQCSPDMRRAAAGRSTSLSVLASVLPYDGYREWCTMVPIRHTAYLRLMRPPSRERILPDYSDTYNSVGSTLNTVRQ